MPDESTLDCVQPMAPIEKSAQTRADQWLSFHVERRVAAYPGNRRLSSDIPVRWYHRHTSPGDDAGRIESYVGHGTGHHLGFQHPPGGCEAVAVTVD